MKKYLALLLLSSICMVYSQSEKNSIPDNIKPLIDSSEGIKAELIGTAKHKNTDYYLINEIGENTGGQKLISVEHKKEPKLIASDTFLFPLDQFKIPAPVVKELAKQYVAHQIAKTPGGISALQKQFSESAEDVKSWMTPDLEEAFRNAGIKLP